MDLDEYTEARLVAELARRSTARRQGICDYCGRTPDTPTCRFPERHREVGAWLGVEVMEWDLEAEGGR